MMGTSQDCARGHVGWWQFRGVVRSDIRTPPRTMPFDLGTEALHATSDGVTVRRARNR